MHLILSNTVRRYTSHHVGWEGVYALPGTGEVGAFQEKWVGQNVTLINGQWAKMSKKTSESTSN